MAKGTLFNEVHTNRDLNLIQQRVEIAPAEPKLNMIDIPGADGSKDLSDLPGGRITYKDRKIVWTFALYPGEKWPDKYRQVNRALNGVRCEIRLDDDPGFYYVGRVYVKKYNSDRLLRQITVEAICEPYMLKVEQTEVTANLTTTAKSISLPNNGDKRIVPKITVSAQTRITWNGATVALDAGEHSKLNIVLRPGDNTISARTVSGSGTIAVTYAEGWL